MPQTSAECLLMLLEASPEPLLFTFETKLQMNFNNIDEIIQTINEIPNVKRMIFMYICLFLRELRPHYSKNKLTDNVLGKRKYLS